MDHMIPVDTAPTEAIYRALNGLGVSLKGDRVGYHDTDETEP